MPCTVIALGTGVAANGYAPNTDRQPPGFLIDADGTLILLDCSEGIRYRIARAGYDYGFVQHVAVTHGHPDHAALPQFIQAKAVRRMWANDHPEFGDCTFYLPTELISGFATVWNWHQPEMGGAYWPEFTPKFMGVKKGSVITIAQGITLKAYPVSHGFDEHPAVAYRVETPHGVIAYSGDSAVCDGLVEAAMDADLFICEQSWPIGYEDRANYGHLTPKDVGAVCARANPKRVCLFHDQGLDEAKDVLREIKKAGFDGEVIRANDGDRWEVG